MLGKEDGYPVISGYPHDSLKSFHTFVTLFSPLGTKLSRTMVPIIKDFFELARGALKALEAKLTIELLVEDLITGLPRLFSDPFRPSSYHKFTRMWLSNIP